MTSSATFVCHAVARVGVRVVSTSPSARSVAAVPIVPRIANCGLDALNAVAERDAAMDWHVATVTSANA